MSCYGLDVMSQRQNSSDTQLEPSEEFPILYRLLTAPKTTSNGDGKFNYSSILTKNKLNDALCEPDSSAYSDDDEASYNTTSSGSTSSSCECDSSEEDCSDHQHHQNSRAKSKFLYQMSTKQQQAAHHRQSNLKDPDEDDDDIYPTSTTTFDIEQKEVIQEHEDEDEIQSQECTTEHLQVNRNLKRTHDAIRSSKENYSIASNNNTDNNCSISSSPNTHHIFKTKKKRLEF